MSKKYKILTIVVSLIIVAVACITYYSYAVKQADLELDKKETGKSNLKGALLLTLAPKDQKGIYNFPMIYPLDGSEDVKYSYLEKLTNNEKQVAIKHTFSSNGDWAAFYSLDKANITQIYRADISGSDNIVLAQDKIKNANQISRATSTNKISVSINNNGDILYSSVLGERAPMTSMDKYETYLIIADSKGQSKEVKLGVGGKAKWIDTENYIFFKKEGLYINNINKKADAAVQITSHRFDDKIRYLADNVMFDISKDGKSLAMTDGAAETLTLYDISEVTKTGNVMKKLSVIDIGAFWPTFSPEGDFVAVQTANMPDIKNNPKPKIKFFEIKKEESKTILSDINKDVDLDAYYQDYMFIDSWVK